MCSLRILLIFLAALSSIKMSSGKGFAEWPQDAKVRILLRESVIMRSTARAC